MSQKILIIEDDKFIRESLAEFLSEEGYLIVPCQNGKEAFDILEKNELPQLILLDIMMPVMDGYQFREKQMANPKWAAIPVIVMSAYGNLEKNKEKLRVEAYLKKPADLDEILGMVRR